MFQSNRKVLRWLTLVVATALLIIAPAKNSTSANLNVWVTDSMERVDRNAQPINRSSIDLYAARGEYESFQIAIRAPEQSIDNINVKISNLQNSKSNLIANKNITLYREHYIRVKNSSPVQINNTNKPDGAGWYPDGLIPFVDPQTGKDLNNAELDAVPFNLSQETTQPIWVDIYVPRDTAPGKYRSQYIVSSNLGEIKGEINLTVWNFELPLKPTLDSAVLLWENNSKADLIELLKHKVMPVADIAPKYQRELIDRWGLKSMRLPFWSGANYQNCTMTPTPSVAEIQESAKPNQPDLRQYVYPTDEIDRCTNLYQPLKQWGKNIHKAGFPHLAVMAPVPELYDTVDIWVVDPKRYNENLDRVKEVLAAGDKVWFYTTLDPEGYSPKWAADYAPINYRIPHGFINQSLGLTGMLYWQADLWTKNPWQNVETYAQPDGRHYPGEGMLVYPGEPVGIASVVPSMRLKWIRDGVEDYEYLAILKRLGKENVASEIARTVAPNWHNWTRNNQKLALARQKIGSKIDRAMSDRTTNQKD
jgi:hypothetical protein